MPGDRLPLLRTSAIDGGDYSSPRSYSPRSIPPPDRIPSVHADRLRAQLRELADHVNARPPEGRDPAASREIVAIRPATGTNLSPGSLISRKDDVQLVGTDPETGTVLVDSAAPTLQELGKKIEAYADDTKVRPKTGKRSYEAAVEAIDAVGLATLEDLAGTWAKAIRDLKAPTWMEVGCRGGRHVPQGESARSYHQIHRQLVRLGIIAAKDRLPTFSAAERLYFFLKISAEQLLELVGSVDCVFEVEPVPSDLLTWILSEGSTSDDISGISVTTPEEDAPSVVVLDTGVATGHPLLTDSILAASSILPGIDSPEDTFGHGTQVSGIALLEDVAGAVANGTAATRHWLQSVRILVEPGMGTADESYWYLWPQFTEEAIERAENDDPRDRGRVFVLPVTRPTRPIRPTLWSQAVDQLAYNDGIGRILCVSAGNTACEQWPTLSKDYPQGQLTQKIHEPAQAANALSVGAFTRRTRLPPEPEYKDAHAVAPEGGISPFSSTGVAGASTPIKPDIVMEGGNLGVSDIVDDRVPTLSALTTSHEWTRARPLTTVNMTSEAVAHAGWMAARILSENRSLRPETIRGLMVHSASWTDEMTRQFSSKADLLAACGYGVPDLDFATHCLDDRCTIVVEDSIAGSVRVEVPKENPTAGNESRQVTQRAFKLFQLPLPDDLAELDDDVELRVTLSYLPEPNRFRATNTFGLHLRWDMQGPHESEEQFLDRINQAARPKVAGKRQRPRQWDTSTYDWVIGPRARSRGTVQSDRWTGPASLTAGSKLLAVMPVLGWWDDREALKFKAMRFSLLTSVLAPNIYGAIASRLEVRPVVDIVTS